ncbi:hypothetical protein CONLIGDRAFT_643740 [Coniochaeta ligniaria NRRL 30616]|uniref:Uncharacterized protein n=1 Tax=Coniochaeta ligniaria NRRL 30616 TaxID=1408157 RepID=A0A1J7IQN3_9PEZI|nr:hypothetical protein CONLIGDRAFT_643740 [Coniochaeta ligniaria NRRL 30616]
MSTGSTKQLSRLYKPLPEVPTSAPSNLNEPLSAAQRKKRAQRHAENEAARSPGKRLMERDDMDRRGKAIPSMSWLRHMETVMRLWCEFCQEKLYRDDGPNFFNDVGLLPDRKMLHQFLYWLADSSTGRLYIQSHQPSTMTETNQVQARTIDKHLGALSSAFQFFGPDREHPGKLFSEAHAWVMNDLTRELNLNRERKPVPTAHYSDVQRIIKAIWSFDSLSVFHNIDAMFHMTLLLNLLVDGGSRIGEFVARDLQSEEQGRYLKWVDIEFWMRPGNDESPVSIYAIITSKWLKNGISDPTKYKEFVIRLLPPHLVFQDSCRLILILALQRGIFRDFKNWGQLMSCQPRQDGSRIEIKPEFADEPIFTSVLGTVWKYSELSRIVQHLGRLAGFVHKVHLHLLRHGDAYLLETHYQSRALIDAHMGWTPGSQGYRHYISKRSTVDVQGMARKLPQVDLTHFSGLSLGACTDAPVNLPPEELLKIDDDPVYVKAKEDVDKFQIKWKGRFSSMADLRKAARSSDAEAKALLDEYEVLANRRASTWARQAEFRFRHFREKAMRELQTALPSISALDISSQRDDGPSRKSDNDESTVVAGIDDIPDDMDSEENISALKRTLGDISYQDATRLCVEAPSTDGISKQFHRQSGHLDVKYRRHRLFRSDLASQVGKIGRSFTCFYKFSHDYTELASIYDELTKSDAPEDFVMAKTIGLLNNEHHVKDLPAEWVSEEDPDLCLVCEEELQRETAPQHVLSCLKKHMKAENNRLWSEYLEDMSDECTWKTVKEGHCSVDLSTLTSEERHNHFFHHYVCARRRCNFDGCMNRFETVDETRQHAWDRHKILYYPSKKCFSFWCRICDKAIYLLPWDPAKQQHFESHTQQVRQLISQYGYNGVEIAKRRFVPGFCAFCVEDRTLQPEFRLAVKTATELPGHIRSHIRKLQATEPGSKFGCPCTDSNMCTYTELMTAEELQEHLQAVHYSNKLAAPSRHASGVSEEGAASQANQDDAPMLQMTKRNRVESRKDAQDGESNGEEWQDQPSKGRQSQHEESKVHDHTEFDGYGSSGSDSD